MIKSKPLASQGNSSGVVNARLFCDPSDNFLIARTCRDELLEFSGINPSEVEKCAIKRTVVMVGPSPTCEFSPAFIERPCGNYAVQSERSPSTARSNSRQVRSERLNSFVNHP